MAVKASATITLTQYRDTQSVTRYYKLQPAGSSAPLKPETKPPSSDWTDSEPACDISKELYFCDLTIFSNGEWEYSKVSKSTSYEAAKQAYNKAQSASDTASAAKDSIDNLEIGGRNLFRKEWYSVAPWNNAVSSVTFINEECLYVDKSRLYNNTNNGTTTLFPNITFEENTQYAISVDYAEAENPSQEGLLYFVFVYSDGSKQAIYMRSKSWTRYTMVSQSNKTVSAITMTYSTNGVNSYIKNLKLEKGSKATDWTPAPEDVDAGIANAQTTADTAKTNAATAQSTADTAKSNAAAAKTAADNAQAAVDEVAEVTDGKLDISDYDSDKEVLDSTIGGINTEIDGIHTTTDNLSKEISNELVAKGYAKITNEPSLELGRNVSDWKIKITNASVDLQKSGISGAKLSPNPERENETLFRTDTTRLSNLYFRSANGRGKLGIVAQSNGHVSLKEI